MTDTPLDRAKVLHQKIRDILLNEWDPIGVRSIAEANDEYDGYVPTIYKMIISRKPAYEIFEYLLWLEGTHMGLTVDRPRTLFIAEKLGSLGT